MPCGRCAVAELDDSGTFLVRMISREHWIRGNAASFRIDLENQKTLTARKPRGPVRRGSDLRLDRMRVVVFRWDEPGLKFFCPRVKPRVTALAESRNPQIAIAVELDGEGPFGEIRLQRRHAPFFSFAGSRVQAANERFAKIV